jgi:beta-fructofuranosidase
MRPRLHFTAERGWLNDPHGITFHDGAYHQFHQAVPGSTSWEPGCHWGHAVGPDLFSLRHRRPAISPGDGDVGIWSGSLVPDRAEWARIYYTTVGGADLSMGRIRAATPADASWDAWDKGDILIEAPAHLGLTAFRDPFVFRDGASWRMYVGGSREGGNPVVVHYVSNDLIRWELRGIALERSPQLRDPVWMGELWECPQQFEVDGVHALLVSVAGDGDIQHAGYALGHLDDGAFVAEAWDRMSYGPSYYAPSFFRDEAARPCVIFWMRNIADVAAGWAGAHSVPYIVQRDADGLRVLPHPDLLQHVAAAGSAVLATTWHPGGEGVLVFGQDGHEVARIRATKWEVVVESAEWAASCPRRRVSTLDIILDGPVLEVVIGGRLLGGPVDSVDAPMAWGSGVLTPLGV